MVYVVFVGVRLLGMSPAAEGAPAASIGITSGIVPPPLHLPIRQKTIPKTSLRADGGLTGTGRPRSRHPGAPLLTMFFDVDVGFGAIT